MSEGARAAGAWACAAALFLAGGAPEAGALKRLRLCNPRGGIRVERTRRGLRLRYLDEAGRPTRVDFTLRGWQLRAALSAKGGACVELGRRKPTGESTLRAGDEVFESGGAFQEKVIYRRTQRVIELGGEKIVIEGTELISPQPKAKK